MDVRPLAERRKGRPVALIMGAGRHRLRIATMAGDVEDAAGPARCADLLARFTGHQVYALGRLTDLLASTGATCWEGHQWKGALTRLVLDGGPTVHPIRRALIGWEPHEAAQGLSVALSWLAGRDVVPGSLGSMAWRLWRSTLDRPVKLSGPPLRDALYGGRQEAPYPGVYRDARYHDLGAAYPASMAAEPYPTRMLRVDPSTALDGAGIAMATVELPRLPWGPIPVRIGRMAVCYGWGTADGYWPWRDLRLARDLGARVTIHESWSGMRHADLFGPWWLAVQEGRALPGAASAVVKALTSAMWGQFALEGDGGRVIRWTNDAGTRRVVVKVQRDRPIPQERTVHLAAETTARVRDRLYRDALLGMPTALYCDTDGVISGLEDRPDSVGTGPGQWGVKATMATLDIRGPQMYRWTCPTCARDHAEGHYCVAGAPTPDAAARMFDRAGRRTKGQLVAMGTPGDITLPAGNVETIIAATRSRRRAS